MKLSILDQVVVSRGRSVADAINETEQLAIYADELGYSRYWIAEHHDLPGLACPAPDVLLGIIGSQTTTIRIGAGAVLLPNYQPYLVAERYHLLATMYPGRIDLGLGRSPGGSAEASLALNTNMLQAIYSMPEKVEELLHFIRNDFPEGHSYRSLKAAPVPNDPPVPWILGTSIKSAKLAAKHGLPYAVGHFMNDESSKKAAEAYKKHFKPTKYNQEPTLILAVSVVCAETNQLAEEIAGSAHIWSIERAKAEGLDGIPNQDFANHYSLTPDEAEKRKELQQRQVFGEPENVKEQLLKLSKEYGSDECMVLTNVHSFEDRLKSYKLLADVILD
ncbi:LLM class flavin-dependent oxidoreductase [Alkalicoccobacillus plakortidis]|uniref:LLM class flavin-dependent oxidoreductase n=1 Tax=Alkalicoccobacillus plakortidis TaxID=444060 RepID=A0ABT0XH36_9BACI|nr:LLM class flavin-dependent oxidoreductase [Alkalicoccobacillus plakortidis]MCM2674517.1 LLM class flavin-dependent oxidoreductase [Alkalicoccobacillus plakortidis]